MKKIKILIVTILLLFVAFGAKAQSGYQYINISAGYLDKPLNSFTGTISLDFAGKYHNGFEIFAEGFRSKYTQHLSFIPDTATKKVVNVTNHLIRHNYMAGAVYKPLLARSENTSFRFKIGGGFGSDGSAFIMAPQAGFELSQTIGGGFELMLQENNAYVFYDEQHWRSGFAIGLKIPLL